MITPVSEPERIEVIDVLRGLALFGMLVVNFNHAGFVRETAAGSYSADQITTLMLKVFADGKFYRLFAFLFGLGFTVQMLRAEARGVSFLSVYTRRLLVLLLLGWAHWILLWGGDQLNEYAVLGFVLLLFRSCSPRTALICAGVCLAFAVIGVNRLLPSVLQPKPRTAEERQVRRTLADKVRTEGAYTDHVRLRVEGFRTRYTSLSITVQTHLVWSTLGLFFMGLYAGKRRIFDDVPAHTGLLGHLLLWGFVMGLFGNLAGVLADEGLYRLPELAVRLCGVVGKTALFLSYASGVTLLFQREPWHHQWALIAPVGRMALTNYVSHSLILTTIFNGYGLGFHKIGAFAALALAVLIFCLQVALSTWWLRHFRFGPLEWLWRSLTYGRLQPVYLPVVAAGATEA